MGVITYLCLKAAANDAQFQQFQRGGLAIFSRQLNLIIWISSSQINSSGISIGILQLDKMAVFSQTIFSDAFSWT